GMSPVVPCDVDVDVDVDDGRLRSSAKAFRSSGDAGNTSVTAATAADGSGGSTCVSPVTLPGASAAGVMVALAVSGGSSVPDDAGMFCPSVCA
ncbi:hypothetical protein CTQ69_29365, partial [Salmonella enterica subsp. diarizonae]|nr:hypothetical protein [Salmonella enterica subsp. diarizonae]